MAKPEPVYVEFLALCIRGREEYERGARETIENDLREAATVLADHGYDLWELSLRAKFEREADEIDEESDE